MRQEMIDQEMKPKTRYRWRAVFMVVERRLRHGDRIAWQDDAWHLFSDSGDGLAFGVTLEELYQDIYDKFSNSDVARGRNFRFDKLRPVLAGIADGKTIVRIAADLHLSRESIQRRVKYCHAQGWTVAVMINGYVAGYELTKNGERMLGKVSV